jgi:hypothetical protein
VGMKCLVCGAQHATCGEYGLRYRPVGMVGEFKPAEVKAMAIVDRPVKRAGDMFTSDKRLYLDGEGNVVGADDPKRKTLLVGEGGQLPMAKAREHGLVKSAEPGDDQAANTESANDESRSDDSTDEGAQPVEGQATPDAEQDTGKKSGGKKAAKKAGKK